MNRIRLLMMGAVVAVGLAVSVPIAAATPGAMNGAWHRNNYNAGEERLFCREATPSWTCTYQVPDATGWFSGRNVTASWTCPEWFPATICDNVTAVYHGVAVYVPTGEPPSGPSFKVIQDYVITEVEGRAVLQLSWVDRFVCPWYRTFEEALANDFNCVFAP
jgi:hypothetical protein